MLLVTAMVDRLSVLGGASLVGASRKRKVSAFASSVCSEHLEDRAMMSAVGVEAADVSTAAKFEYTDISGDYTPTIEPVTNPNLALPVNFVAEFLSNLPLKVKPPRSEVVFDLNV